MSWERLIAGGLLVGGLAAWVAGMGVLAAVLLIFGAAGLLDVVNRGRRERRAEMLAALRDREKPV